MDIIQKHQIALANIQKIYQAGWLPTVPYNSSIAPIFTCVVDADRIASANLHITNKGQWLFIFTIGHNTHQFTHTTIPTVKQVKHIFKTYYQTALKQGELITDLSSNDLQLLNQATAAGWVFFGIDQTKQHWPAIFVGRITEAYFAALSQQIDGWEVKLPFHTFSYTALPHIKTVKQHFNTIAGVLKNREWANDKGQRTNDKNNK